MTAEKQYVDEFESAYQGKTWGKGKIFGILLSIFAGLVIRDIGMAFIYGSIYDKFAEEGMEAGISIVNYALMVLLYMLPLIFPMILRFTNGAYDNEIESPLLPSFSSKVASIIGYVVIGLVCVIPVVLFAVGMFTTAYMFVSINLALLIFTTITLFYYLGTYILQRARVPLAKKHKLPTLFMIVTAVPAMIVSVGILIGLYYAGVNVSLIDHVRGFVAEWNLVELILKAVGMLMIIFLSLLAGGLLYNRTQNIIYAGAPAFLFANANIIILQRLKETSDFFATIADYEARIAETTNSKQLTSLKNQLAEYQANFTEEVVAMVLGYLLIALMVAVLVFLIVYAIVGLAKVRKLAK